MSRVGLVAVFTALVGVTLSGCSGSSLSMPDWLSSKPSAPQLLTLHFQSEPPGAEVRTGQGQTCQTPCSLPAPPESQSVTFGKNGYLTQTAQVSVREPAERSFFARNPPPTLVPDPVEVMLQPAVPAAKPTAKLKHRRTALNSRRQPAPVQPAPQSAESPVPTSAQQQQ
jgi:PEGA domain